MALDEMMVVIEYANRGSLLTHLRSQQRGRTSLPVQTRQDHTFALAGTFPLPALPHKPNDWLCPLPRCL